MQSVGTPSVATAGDGIFSACTLAPVGTGTAAAVYYYGLSTYSVTGLGTQFYECRTGIETYSLTFVDVRYNHMWSDHTTANPVGAYTDGATGVSLNTSTTYSQYDIEFNYIANSMNGITYNCGTDAAAGNLYLIDDTVIGAAGYYTPGTGIAGFCNVGMALINSGAPVAGSSSNVLEIEKNDIVDVYNGIVVGGMTRKHLYDEENDIMLIANALSPGAQQCGIKQYASGNSIVNGNYVEGDPSVTVLAWTNGIYGSANSTTQMNCNAVYNTDTGFNFSGSSPNTTSWYDNTMQQDTVGMCLNSTIGPISAPGVGVGDNIWIGGGTWFAGGPPWETYCYVNPTGSPMYVRNPPNVDFDNVGTNSGISGFYYRTSTPVSIHTVTTTYSVTSCAPTTPSFTYSTYRVMSGGAGIDSMDTANVNFWAQEQPVYEGIVQLVNSSLDSLADDVGARQNWVSQKAVFDAMQQDTSLADSSAILREFYALSQHSRYHWLSQIDSALNAGNTSLASALLTYPPDPLANTSQDSATGVKMADGTDADAVINNYLWFYSSYLNYMQGAMSAYDTAMITSIAALCPMQNGAVVYRARSVYWMLYHNLGNFIDRCQIDYSSSRKMEHSFDKESLQSYILYPNPNNGNLTLQQKIVDINPVEITITSIFGTTLLKQTGSFAGGVYQLRLLPNTAAGMYLMEIRDKENRRFNLKFVVE